MVAGLLRKSVQRCSKWACKYRYMGKPIPGIWTFKYHPWGREMHDSKAGKNIGMKAAQMGFTEWALNRTFFKIDVDQVDCLYVLPNKTPDASDFSSARFDTALELSPHLTSLFSDVKNVGHKRAGSVNLYVRGSRSRGGMKSIPVGHMTLDEFDEMDKAMVVLALERMSGQFTSTIDILSTPTIPDVKIDAEYKLSTQEHYMFQCPLCGKLTELIYPECFVVTAEDVTDPAIHGSYIRCKECQGRLNHEEKHIWLKDKGSGGTGFWQPTVSADPDVRGFAINQLYSSTMTPVKFARAVILSELDPTEETEFHNSKLGQPHVVEGAQVTDTDIVNCIGNYVQQELGSGIVTMGVDIGNYIHVEIDEWQVNPGPDINTQAMPKVIAVRKLRDFEELDPLMRQFQVMSCVVDMMPETRKAKEFADRFFGFVKLCYYGRGVASKSIVVKQDDTSVIVDHQITVNRTSWLDVSLGRFMSRRILLPRDIPHEYREQIKNQVRVYEKDKDGNPVSHYETLKNADHYGHARTYAEIALPFAVAIATGEDVVNFL